MDGAEERGREPADWMELPLDHDILEAVRDRGPFQIHQFEQSNGDLHGFLNRVQLLVGYGLLQKREDRLHLTEWGEAYLEGGRAGGEFEME
jgi:hypothetical protein